MSIRSKPISGLTAFFSLTISIEIALLAGNVHWLEKIFILIAAMGIYMIPEWVSMIQGRKALRKPLPFLGVSVLALTFLTLTFPDNLASAFKVTSEEEWDRAFQITLLWIIAPRLIHQYLVLDILEKRSSDGSDA